MRSLEVVTSSAGQLFGSGRLWGGSKEATPSEFLSSPSMPEPSTKEPGQAEQQAWKGRVGTWGEAAGGGDLGAGPEDFLWVFSR